MARELIICKTSRGEIAEIFDRLDDGRINLDSLENRVLMIETRRGARYSGLVARGDEGKLVLYTGKEIYSKEGKLEGWDINGYVLPLENARYTVEKNTNKDSSFRYFLATQDIGPLDLVEDRTLFEKELAEFLS